MAVNISIMAGSSNRLWVKSTQLQRKQQNVLKFITSLMLYLNLGHCANSWISSAVHNLLRAKLSVVSTGRQPGKY